MDVVVFSIFSSALSIPGKLPLFMFIHLATLSLLCLCLLVWFSGGSPPSLLYPSFLSFFLPLCFLSPFLPSFLYASMLSCFLHSFILPFFYFLPSSLLSYSLISFFPSFFYYLFISYLYFNLFLYSSFLPSCFRFCPTTLKKNEFRAEGEEEEE